jgi:hypothetical protein
MTKRVAKFKDETDRIIANEYLAEKLNQSRKDADRGTKIPIENLWTFISTELKRS